MTVVLRLRLAMSTGPFDDVLAQSAWLRRLAVRLGADSHGADDLVQQTFVVALRAPLRPTDRPRAWLAAILRNLARTDRRARSRRWANEAKAARPEAACDVEHEERDEALVRALDSLSEPYRTTLALRYLDDLPAVAIARRTGRPASLVRSHVARGILKLRMRLGVAALT